MRNLTVLAALAATLSCSLSCSGPSIHCGPNESAAAGRTFYVDGGSPIASDANAGTQDRPWRTLARAGSAKELQPGDTVLIKAGTYRQSMSITVSGAPGRPVTFAAAPGERVVIKGSEIIRGVWMQVSKEPSAPEPYPNAYSRIWKIRLGEEYFFDPVRPQAMKDKAQRDVTQIVLADRTPLQKIGPSRNSTADPGALAPLGTSQADLVNMRDGAFFFDAPSQTLYLKAGDPRNSLYELGVRGDTLIALHVHDVVIRGLEVRHSRGNMAALAGCQRVTLEDCRLMLADFCNLGIYESTNCTVRRCDLSWAANTGLTMHRTSDCTIEDCTVTFNNYCQYAGGWHDGGMKNIPTNRRSTIRRCEVAYNFSGGIWFDTANTETRLLDNVIHHNRGPGIFHELNFGGGVFAGNLIFANGGDGIVVATHYPRYMVRRHWVEEAKAAAAKGEGGWAVVSPECVERLGGADNIPDGMLWIVNNTLAGNLNGVALHDRYGSWENLQNVRVMNNLLLGNFRPEDLSQGVFADLLFMMHAPKDDKRIDTSNHTDFNVFAAPTVLKPDFGDGNTRTFAQWQQRFGEDTHSKVLPVQYDISPTGFRLLSRQGLDIATLLPPEVRSIWQPSDSGRVGSNLTAWTGNK